MKAKSMETLINYAKNYGFVYQGSEIYGGLANTWDYGPLGVELKNNLKQAFWKRFVQESPYNVGLDSSILLNPNAWVASGHVGGFNDPLIDCKACQTRHRADHLIETYDPSVHADGMKINEMEAYIKDNHIPCPACGKHDFTTIRQFNLMFKTSQGVVDEQGLDLYLRPETAQGIFLDFKHVQRTSRLKVPFGIVQIGKSFRNEITPGNFIFRTREFEQMELEFFCKPGTEKTWFDYWKKESMQFLIDLNLHADNLTFEDHDASQLSHYSNMTTDIEYKYPFGFDELWGIASRTDYDLTQHQTHSETSLEYMDPVTNEKYIPYVVEPSLGVERLFLAVLNEAYTSETLESGEERINLNIHPALAPYKVAVLPLIKKHHKEEAEKVYRALSKHVMAVYDEAGKIGRRYRRQDAIGTPFAVTIDHDSLEDGTYTLRDKNTMEQTRLSLDEIIAHIEKRIKF